MRQVSLDGDPGKDPEPAREYMSHRWFGNIWRYSWRSLNPWSGIQESGLTFSVCCYHDLDLSLAWSLWSVFVK